jgi:hypothetical protein
MEVRDKFSQVLSDPTNLNASTRQIAKNFLATHRSAISKEAWDEVMITGLVQIMGKLRGRRRRPSGGSLDTLDLFAGFDIDPIVVVRVVEKGKGSVEKNKDVSTLTLPEALDYLACHTKERVANTNRVREWRRLISRVRPFMTEDGMTLGDGLRLAKAAEAKKKEDKKA